MEGIGQVLIFRWLTATSRAFTRDSGATRESTKEAMSLRAMREYREMGARGEVSPSVMAMVVAPRSLAKLIAWTVRLEYRGKLMPMTASPSPTRSRLSNISLEVLADTSTTLSKIRLK